MGIGANNFFVAAATRGYFERANVTVLSRNLIPHNAYWTAAAETGYMGLLALMTLLIRPLQLAFFCGWRNRNDRGGDLLLGLATSFLIVCIHSYFEWNFFLDQIQYVFAIDLGLIAGLTGQLGYWRPAKRLGKHS
jgi:O-antigen ligase